MRLPISSAALGLALVAGAPAAHAQTMITSGPMVTYPAATVVQTTETVRTVRPWTRFSHRQVVTTRTTTQQFMPARTVMARTFASSPQPLYDEVTPAPYATGPRPLYDEVVSAPYATSPRPLYDEVVSAPPVAQNYAETYNYRYIYQPDRILVIDPNTGVAIQAIPR
jgi:hypothetical protein